MMPTIPRGVLLTAALVLSLGVAPGVRAQARKSGAEKSNSKKVEKASDTSKSPAKSPRELAEERALLKATEKVNTLHLKELEKIASWAISNGLKEEAGKVLGLMRGIDSEFPALSRLKELLDKASPPKDESKVTELKTTFGKKLEEANDKNGRKLFELASGCMKLGLFTRAFDLVSAVIEADPDHKRARDILGYAWDSSAKKWITKYDAEMQKKYLLTDEGWVKKEDKKKWDSGQREYNGRWVSREEEDRIRKRNTYNPFFAETEHFRVETNLGRKQAFQFASQLEDFYRAFFRFYIGYYDQAQGTKLLFNQAKLKKRHQVAVFPSRTDYLTFVKAEKGNNELLVRSGGFFSAADAKSFFFWSDDPESTYGTLYHEVTHQLLAETKQWGSPSSGHMWVVEGIATYMETWQVVGGKWQPGVKTTIPQMQMIMGFLKQSKDWSIGQYIGIDYAEFHKPEQRGFNYSMGGALCHFFLHYQGEIYKEGFVRFLKAFYEGRTSGEAVINYLDVEDVASDSAKIEALTKQFRDHMQNLEASLAEGKRPKAETQKGEGSGR